MARKLKVYGWQGWRTVIPGHHKTSREIIAATSIKEVLRLTGETSRSKFFNLGQTWNGPEVQQAMSEPGVRFWRPVDAHDPEP